jgi:hypothetical protein
MHRPCIATFQAQATESNLRQVGPRCRFRLWVLPLNQIQTNATRIVCKGHQCRTCLTVMGQTKYRAKADFSETWGLFAGLGFVELIHDPKPEKLVKRDCSLKVRAVQIDMEDLKRIGAARLLREKSYRHDLCPLLGPSTTAIKITARAASIGLAMELGFHDSVFNAGEYGGQKCI